MFDRPVTFVRGIPTVELALELAPGEDPNYLPRRVIIYAIAAVRRRLEPSPEFSLARRLVPAGDVLQQIAQAVGLTQLEAIEALGAALVAEILWPDEEVPA